MGASHGGFLQRFQKPGPKYHSKKHVGQHIFIDTPTYWSVQVLASTHVVDEISDLRQRAAKGLGKGQA